MNTNATLIWRYATKVGEQEDQQSLQNGWFIDE
jgi:hypothetical protein